MKNITVGDIVCLRSGGPLMTVSSVSPDYVKTVWFGADNIEHSGVFPIATLERKNK